jgi:hypothetical protein
MGRDYGASSEALLPSEHSPFFVPASQRTRTDFSWTISWVVLYIVSVGVGLYAFLNRNVDFLSQLTPTYLNDPSNCPVEPPPARKRFLLSLLTSEDPDTPMQMDEFLSHSLVWLIVSLMGAAVIGTMFVYLVTKSPSLLVWLSIGVQVGLPLGAGASVLLQGGGASSLPLLLLAALLIFTFWMWRSQLQLVIQLLGVSGHGLADNLGLVGAVLGLQGGMFVLLVPLFVSIMAAVINGKVIFNPERSMESGGAHCVDAEGQDVMCCAWQTEPYVAPLVALIILTLSWTSFIGAEVRTFTVAGTIAQWYFAPAVTEGSKAASGGRVGRSLAAALGPSFGSLCFGGLVLTVVNILRNILEQLRKKGESNMLMYCLFIIVQYIFTLIELVTKFATVRLAITGEDFLVASRSVGDLLNRNFLDTFGVWWFPPMILNMTSLVISAVWSLCIYSFSAASWSGLVQGHQYAVALATITFIMSAIVLSFFTSLLLNIIDAVFICFAMDRDMHQCSRLEVHEVYTQLPKVGPVVENPDGAYAYAAPARQHAMP